MERPLADRRGDQPGKGNLERTDVHSVVEQRVRRRLIQLPAHGVYRVNWEASGCTRVMRMYPPPPRRDSTMYPRSGLNRVAIT